MVDKKDEDKTTKKSDAPPKRRRKDIPSVDYLLKHGDPDTAHLPKTNFEKYGYPFILALIFAISLLIFHHAPHENARPRKKYTLPNVKTMPFFDRRPTAQDEPKKQTEL
ncbi:unnamed protein product [Pseudo-nitzschia multistriata]|uniref:Uncharacterized protein n=1 Tax=Pseudo-nitzschia multistriata TaxID=183589 RepID=A0A448ZS56_9STRA|nr:unnamed protein product [Pseudo-nitzschia multistriata]